jgi:hypothetical protein
VNGEEMGGASISAKWEINVLAFSGDHPSRAGNNILKSLKPEYAIIKTNAGRNRYSPVFSVQGLQGSKIDSKRSQIIAVETTMQSTYVIASPNRRGYLSDIIFGSI